jgi:hypothetical protein
MRPDSRRAITLDTAWLGAVMTRQGRRQLAAVRPSSLEARAELRAGARAGHRSAPIERLDAHERALDGLFATWNALATECERHLGTATPSQRPGEPTIYY